MPDLDVPNWLIWALLVAVVVEGFSMALLVYLMFRRQRKQEGTPRVESPPPEEEPAKKVEEEESETSESSEG